MALVDDSAQQRRAANRRPRASFAFAFALALTAAATLAAQLAFHPPDLSTEAMVLLVGVAASAHWCGRWPSFASALLAALAFNFLFIEPRFTFTIAEPSYVLAFTAMAAVGLGLAGLVAAVRGHAAAAHAREVDLAASLSFTRSLAEANEVDDVGRIAIANLLDVVAADLAVFVVVPGSQLEAASIVASHGPTDWLAPDLLAAARTQCIDDEALPICDALGPLGRGLLLPMRSQRGTEGILALHLREAGVGLTTHQRALVLSFAQQAGEALERIASAAERVLARSEIETERLRSTLLASVSHDLRTPLTTITGAASRLVHEASSLDAVTRDELAGSLLSESNRLNDLVANLLFATRLESGAITLRKQWTSVAEVVGSALGRSPLEGRTVDVRIAPDLPFLDADPILLEQAIFNLLDNAARHTPPGTRVAIRGNAQDDAVVVDVEDDGPGIDPERRDSLFRRFARGRHSSGLGLGLAICSGIVQAHGGHVQVEPVEPRGTRFRLRLPVPSTQPRLPESEATP